ncbi:MAG TPA: DUF1015 domain-containing protein, partial [Mycobacteriales bacterium]|nr:DUF1015 domain-containing protein [Mycobacteriales bacterium]
MTVSAGGSTFGETKPAGADPGVPVSPGLVLAPFRALRFDEAVAGPLASLICPPYDVIDDAEVEAYEQASIHNIVRVILPRGDASGPQSRYRRAADLLDAWRRDGVLRPDDAASVYVLEMRDGAHVLRGLVGVVALCDPEQGVILPHENVMAGPVSDRLLLTAATATNTEPIFLIYDGGGAASEVVAGVDDLAPVAQVRTDDGIEHRLWAISDPAVLAAVAADLLERQAVIADGHHRYANYRQHQAAQHAAGAGPGPWDFGLTLLVDATVFGPQVHAIHRVVATLTLDEAIARAGADFATRRLGGDLEDALESLATAGKEGQAYVVSDGTDRWLLSDPDPVALAEHLPGDRSQAWRDLDVTVAHVFLIQHLWGLTDDETTVGYRHSASAAEDAALDGGIALLLNPTPVEALISVASAGERMPRKST